MDTNYFCALDAKEKKEMSGLLLYFTSLIIVFFCSYQETIKSLYPGIIFIAGSSTVLPVAIDITEQFRKRHNVTFKIAEGPAWVLNL